MAECTVSKHEDVVMTDLDGEDYNIGNSSTSSQSTVTLPTEVWAAVIDCEYIFVVASYTHAARVLISDISSLSFCKTSHAIRLYHVH